MDSLGDVAAVSLILPSRTGHDAPPLHDQQSLQIAQSLLLLDWFDQQYAVSSRPEVVDWLESVAQPTCGFLIRFWNSQLRRRDTINLDHQLRQLVRHATAELQVSQTGKNAARDVVELILELTDSATRRGRGAYFTPPELARFVVSRVNCMLQKQAATDRCTERVQYILDPAVGAGIFLMKAIECEFEWFAEFGQANLIAARKPTSFQNLEGHIARPQPLLSEIQMPDADLWSEHAAECLLPRLIGCDVLLPSLLATHLNTAVALEKTGFDFRQTPRLNLFLANCLADFEQAQSHGTSATGDRMRETQPERDLAFEMLRSKRVSVIIGNPPFYSMSQNDGRWIQSLLRGECIASSGEVSCDSLRAFENKEPSYFEVDGEPLKEKKAWLHDDYVKFIRYAQWQIDRAGSGVLGFVTNRGFLDNITFRGMRYQLLQSFDEIEILDLHGDSRNRASQSSFETANGERDENIFNIETGVAITVFGKQPISSVNGGGVKSFTYESLEGSRNGKLTKLGVIDCERDLPADTCTPNTGSALNEIHPAGPHYFFIPRDVDLQREYETGFRLCDIMPQAWSAPVTARDHFVVAFDTPELEERLVTFRDLSASDHEVRLKFFQRTRSAKYQSGDTRSWKLAEARKQVAADDNWRDCFQTCTYRPFDKRSVYWSNAMIDWPRNELVEQMQIDGNLALIGRRQSPRDAEYHFFFVAEGLMLDGILRSDNRGNESIFPLYVKRAQSADGSRSGQEACRFAPNFSADFIEFVCHRWQIAWTNAQGDLIATIGPRELFSYVYAIVHASVYRQRYREWLCIDFPRVFVCRTKALAKQLIALGERLVASHLLREVPTGRAFVGAESMKTHTIATGFPKYGDEKVYLNNVAHLPDVPQQVWQHHIGSHQVARKWLKDRRGRSLSDLELQTYARIIAAIENTIGTCQQIDRAIDTAGGWQISIAE